MYLIKTIKGDITNITDEEKRQKYAAYKVMHQKGTCINRFLN